MSDKKSIRFYNDREVRAVWDDENSKWWFSATDVVRAINNEEDYVKAGNYWRWLKRKLKTQGFQFVSGTHKLKITAEDGKKYTSDVLDAEEVNIVATNIPNNRATAFLNWFTYSDNSTDGQSRKKAYDFWESNLISANEVGTTRALQKIHAYIFGGLYDFAGKIRTKNISKGSTLFCLAEYLQQNLKTIEQMPEDSFDEIVDKYVEMNMAHPFMEGNGRSTRIWLDLIFKKRLGLCVDWSRINKSDYLEAMTGSRTDSSKIRALLRQAMTGRIDDREIFMKGIDYSYYYEQED